MCSRNPSNTAVFLLIFQKWLSKPYISHFAHTKQTIQELGFEPRVVTSHPFLISHSNLFINMNLHSEAVFHSPLDLTRNHWRENNLIISDRVRFSRLDLAFMLVESSPFQLFWTREHTTAGIFFKKMSVDELFKAGDFGHKVLELDSQMVVFA